MRFSLTMEDSLVEQIDKEARLVQENSLLMHRLLPAPKPGAISRFRRWLSGNGEE